MTGHSEASARNLFDGALFGIAIVHRLESFGILTAFARVGPCPEAVHCDGEGFVSFLGNRAVGHRTGLESLHDFGGGLDFINRDRLAFVDLEFHESADRVEIFGLIIDQLGIFLEQVEVPQFGGLLEEVNCLRVKEMTFAVGTPLIDSAGVEGLVLDFARFESICRGGL